MAADGSVVLDVKMNVDKAEKQYNKLVDNIKKTEEKISDIERKRDKAQGVLDSGALDNEKTRLDELKTSLDQLQDEKITWDSLEHARANAEKTEASIQAMVASGKELYSTRDALSAPLEDARQQYAEMQKNYRDVVSSLSGTSGEERAAIRGKVSELSKQLHTQEARVKGIRKQWDEADSAIKKYEQDLASAMEMLQKQQATVAQLQAQAPTSAITDADIDVARQKIAEQEQVIKETQTEWDKANKEVSKYNDQIEEANIKLERQKEDAGEAARNLERVREELNGVKDGLGDSGGFLDKLDKKLKQMLKRVFVFSVITSALRAMRTWLGNVIKKDEQAAKAIAQLKAALLTLAQPLVEVIIPAFVWLVKVLSQVAAALANVISRIFGKTLSQSAAAAKALNGEADALDNVGEAAKEAAGSLAGFDEINTISTNNQGATASPGGSSKGAIAPDFTSLISGELDGIVSLFAGTALLALGAILTFSGINIALGIPLMALGALTIWSAVSTNWDSISQQLQGPLGKIFAYISGASLVIGAILAFSAVNIPLGIALMAIGAAGLAATVAANWNEIVTALQGPMGKVVALVSAELFILGVILAFCGALPLGIGLMIAGAAGIATTVAVNWNAIVAALQGPIGKITAMISGVLLVIGVILLICGVVPLGLGLVVAGVGGLAAAIAPNWDFLVEKVKHISDSVVEIANGLWDSVKSSYSKFKEKIAQTWDNVSENAVEAWDNIILSISEKVSNIKDNLSQGLSNIKRDVSSKVSEIKTDFTNSFTTIKISVTNSISNIKTNTINSFNSIKSSITSSVSNILSSVTNSFTNIKNNVTSAMEGMKISVVSVFNGLKNAIRTPINGILGFINRMISGIVSGINGVISTLNSFSFSIPDWVPGWGGRSIGFNIGYIGTPQIPLLAQGAVIPPGKPFMAFLGDQSHGNNLEAPESLIRKIVREESGTGNAEIITLLQRLVDLTRDGHVITVDGTTFGRTAIKTINSVNSSAGKQLLNI